MSQPMVPPKSHPIWKQLVRGEVDHQFKVLAGGMCVSRVIRFVKRADNAPGAVDMAIDDLHAFFSRLENDLTEDIKAIFDLGNDHVAHDR